MADLFNQQISATYSGLLKTTSNGVLSSSLAQITDGRGNGSQLYLSTSKINFYNAYEFPTSDGSANQVLKTDGSGVLTWEDDANTGGVTKTGTIALNTIAVWNDSVDQLRSDTSMSINTNHTISLLQPNSVPTDVGSYNIGGGNIANVTGSNNVGFGSTNLVNVSTGNNNVAIGNFTCNALTTGGSNTAIGINALNDLTEGDYNTAIGAESLSDVSTGDNNTAIGKDSGATITTGSGNILLGVASGDEITTGSNNVIIGTNAGSATLTNNIIISDGSGNNRLQFSSTGAATFSGDVEIKNSVVPTLKLNNTDTSLGSQTLGSIEYYQNDASDQGVGTVSRINCVNESSFAGLGALTFETGNATSITERLRISSGGDVLINATSKHTAYTTSTTLKVSSNSGVDQFPILEFSGNRDANNGNQNAMIQFWNKTSTAVEVGRITSSQGSGVNYGELQFATASNGTLTESMRITSGGLVNVSSNLSIGGSGENNITALSGSKTWIGSNRLRYNTASGSATGTFARSSATEQGAMMILTDTAQIEFYTQPSLTQTGTYSLTPKLTISSGGLATFSNDIELSRGSRTTIYASSSNQGVQLKSNGSGVLQLNADGGGNVTICENGGNVGIGVSALSAERLTVDGMTSGNTTFSMLARNSSLTTSFWIRDNGDGYLRANAWIYGSDLRLKENISDVENGIDMVSKMKPKHFDYIDGSKDNLGFIAQDVQKIIPQAVSITDQEKGTLGLKTDFLVPYLVKAIQEQQTIIEDLKARIETLEG